MSFKLNFMILLIDKRVDGKNEAYYQVIVWFRHGILIVIM